MPVAMAAQCLLPGTPILSGCHAFLADFSLVYYRQRPVHPSFPSKTPKSARPLAPGGCMLSRSSALRTVTVLVIVALLLNTLAPIASAQDGGGNVYLPAVSGGQSASVRRSRPARTAAVLPHLGGGQHRRPVAEPGAHRSRHRRARRQLGAAARRRPAAGRPRPPPLQPGQHQCSDHARRCSSQPGCAAALRPRGPCRAGAHGGAGWLQPISRLWLPSAPLCAARRKRLTSADLSALAAVASVDTDADGLTDDQEAFWCTDPARARQRWRCHQGWRRGRRS